MTLFFPRMHSDRMETIFYHYSMKFSTYGYFFFALCGSVFVYFYPDQILKLLDYQVVLSLAIALICTFISGVSFSLVHRPNKYNLIISSLGLNDMFKEVAGYLLAALFMFIFFQIVLPAQFQIDNFISFLIYTLLSSYFVSGIMALFLSSLVINCVRFYWFFSKR